ncbi:MAG: hypothetical protein AABX40_05875 [Candidatus Hydrothermarchaeota archaeon]
MVAKVVLILGLIGLGFVLYLIGERIWREEKRMAREGVTPAPVIE